MAEKKAEEAMKRDEEKRKREQSVLDKLKQNETHFSLMQSHLSEEEGDEPSDALIAESVEDDNSDLLA